MRHLSCLRHVLVGLVLISAVTPIVLAAGLSGGPDKPWWECWRVTFGGGAGPGQSGGDCVGGNCVRYESCQKGDVCKRAIIGVMHCTPIPVMGLCLLYVNGTPGPDGCCSAGTFRGLGRPAPISIADVGGACGFGQPLGRSHSRSYNGPGDMP